MSSMELREWLSCKKKGYRFVRSRFCTWMGKSGKTVMEFQEIPEEMQEYPRHFMMVGPPASGKTTMLHLLTIDIERGTYYGLTGRKVIFVNLRLFDIEKEYTTMEVILGANYKYIKDPETVFNSYAQQDEKLVLIFDNLDALRYSLNDKKPRVNCGQLTKIDTIIFNIFIGYFFPNSKIITCSRVLRPKSLHDVIKPKRLIYIDGLGENAMKSLTNEYMPQCKPHEMMRYVRTKNPGLWPLLTLPGFLSMATEGYSSNSDFKPKTMTGIMVQYFLKKLGKSPGYSKTYLAIFDHVKALAYHLMTQGRWFLTEEDLAEFKLTKSDVMQCYIIRQKQQPTHPMEFNVRYEQEFYAGFHTMHMEMDEFYKFAANNVYGTYFLVSARVATSLLFDEEVRKVAELLTQAPFRHIEEKKQLMSRFFKDELTNIWAPSRLMEVLTILYEGQDGISSDVGRDVRDIVLERQTLLLSDIQATSFFVLRCVFLREIALIGCKLTDRKVDLFCSSLLQSKILLVSLDVSENDDMGPDSMYFLARVVAHCKVQRFAAAECRLNPGHIRKFAEGIGNATFDYLNVDKNTFLEGDGMYHLGKIVGHCLVDEFHASGCSLKDEEWKRFFQGHTDTRMRQPKAQRRNRVEMLSITAPPNDSNSNSDDECLALIL